MTSMNSMNSNTQFYSWRQAILKSSLPPTTRHVLLTLSCHMNDAGESCYPSIELLCEETGLSNRAVITHLKLSEDAGWIEVEKHGFRGRKWARNEYKIAWPERINLPIEAVNVVHHLNDEAVNDVHHLNAQGSERSDIKAVNVVHTNYPENYPISPTSVGDEQTTPKKPASTVSEVTLTDGRFVIADALYDRWKETYSGIDLEQELGKAELWLDANPKRMPKILKKFVVNWLSRAQSDRSNYLAARSQPQPSRRPAQPSQKQVGSFQSHSHTGNSDPVRSLVSERR